MRRQLMRIHHDSPYSGHFGRAKTRASLQRNYSWQGMARDIDSYVSSCTTCQTNKTPRHRPYGLLQKLEMPTGPWKSISMDFVTGLPEVDLGSNKKVDAILVVVDRYSKMARYVACRKDIKAPEMATVLLHEVFKHYGYPESIISDRGSLFTSDYWADTCFYLKIHRSLSTAYHPQSDGQTEVQNRSLEQYLRCYVNFKQNDWPYWLDLAEIAYNRSRHSLTQQSPYMLMHGYEPRFLEDDMPTEARLPTGDSEDRLQKLKGIRQGLQKLYLTAKEAQENYYNKKHREQTFQIGDRVMLAAKNIRSLRPHRKLDAKYYGPFEILERIGRVAYKLQLPEAYSIHPTFHVSLLEPYTVRPGETVGSPPSLLVADRHEWEVEEILDHKFSRRTLLYLVKWKGYSVHDATWEPESNVANAPDLLQQYNSSLEPPSADSHPSPSKAANHGNPPKAGHAPPKKGKAGQQSTKKVHKQRRQKTG